MQGKPEEEEGRDEWEKSTVRLLWRRQCLQFGARKIGGTDQVCLPESHLVWLKPKNGYTLVIMK